MTRLGKFFRKHLGKYFLSRPPSEPHQAKDQGTNEQSKEDSGHTSALPNINENIVNTSNQSNEKNNYTTDVSTSNIQRISSVEGNAVSEEHSSREENLSQTSSTVKSTSNNLSQPRVERQPEEELSLFPDPQRDSTHADLDKLKVNDQIYQQQTEAARLHCSTSYVQLASDCRHQQTDSVEHQEAKPNLDSSATGNSSDSIQNAGVSIQPNLLKDSPDIRVATHAETPIHITIPESTAAPNPLAKSSSQTPLSFPPDDQVLSNQVGKGILKSKTAEEKPAIDSKGWAEPENEIVQSSQLAETLKHAGQLKDMVSKPQSIPSAPPPKFSDLPSNSTSLRNYLESTSVRRPTSPSQVSAPKKLPVVPNRRPPSPRSTSPRPSAPSDKSVTSVRGQSPTLRPSSAKKNSEIKDTSKDGSECPHKTDEDKNTGISSPDEQEVSLVALIEVSDSTKEVIESAMKKFGMKETTTQGYWNIRWSDNGVSIQVCQRLQKYQRINRFPGSGLLMTKNNLAKNTSKMKLSFPEDYDFVPETWCLSGDISKVEQYARAHDRDCFIVKPNDGSSGKGIIITRNIAKLKTCEKMVCQVYIRKPYLIDGFKFDLRIYTLITSCRPLRLFVYNEGLARFATERYEEPSPQNESNRYMHLTNYAVNKRSPSYTVDETKGTLRRLSTINKWLLRNNVDAKKVWESMDEAIVKTIISFLPALRHNYRVSFPEQTDSNSCFQILGFDIIFDQTLKPYVLEVNDSPSFKADVPLDKEMTESLIHDTFNILHLDENNRSKVLMEEKRQSRLRLLSSSSQNRNAIHKEKEQNERLLTQSRIEWENNHMGNYRKVYPNEQKMKHYKKFIRAATEIFTKHV